MDFVQHNSQEERILKVIEACSIFYDFDVLKRTLSSSFSKEDLFKQFLRTYAGARPNAPKQFYLLGVQFVSEYGIGLAKMKKQLRCFLPNMKESYNLFETRHQNKNIHQLWESIYHAIGVRDFEKAYYTLCDLKGIKGKIAAFFLRDVGAVLLEHNHPGEYTIEGTKKHFIFMQPIDVWLREMVTALSDGNVRFIDLSDVPRKFVCTLVEGKRDCKRIKWILEKCRYYSINPLCFNQGAWFLGSQIVGNKEYWKKLLQKSEGLLNAIKNTKICLDENRFSVFLDAVDSLL